MSDQNPQNPIDYNALAKQAGAISSQPASTAAPASTVDYSALAKQAGAISSQPAQPKTVDPKSPVQNQSEFSDTGVWNAVKRVGSNLVHLPEQVYEAAHTPDPQADVMARFGGVPEPIMRIAHAFIIKPGVAEAAKAAESAKEGHYSEAVGHAGAAALPGAGPWAANVGERIGSGDISGGITEAALSLAAPEIVKGAGKFVAKTAGETAKKFGLGGLTPVEGLEKAGRPSVYERNFKENAEIALPRLVEENKSTAIKTPEHLSDAAHNAAQKVWSEVDQQIQRHKAEVISGQKVSDAIRNGVEEGVRDLFPEEAQKADEFAKKFTGDMTLEQASKRIQTLNAQLRKYYKLDPSARYAAGINDAALGAVESAADALRDEVYGRLEKVGEPDPSGLRKQYGALKQMERVFEKRSVVHGRQAPLSLPDAVGAIAAVASGHPGAVAVPLLTKYLNSPETLIKRAVKAEPSPNSIAGSVAQRAPQLAEVTGSNQPD